MKIPISLRLRLPLLKHDIHIKPKSYKLELLEELMFNMVLELGLERGLGFEPLLCNLNIGSPFVYLKVHSGLYGLFDSPCARVWGRMHVKEGIKA